MISPAEEDVVEQAVGPSTFARGLAYARTGAVTSYDWGGGRSRLVGEVKGTASRPYWATVVLTRVGDRLTGFAGFCTCPIRTDCKHAVALLLAARADDDDGHPDDRTASPPGADRSGSSTVDPGGVSWEDALLAVLHGEEGGEDDGGRSPSEPAAMGLQFELSSVPERPVRQGSGRRAPAGRTPATGERSIRVRPVVLSPAGNWVRTGISWSSLDYVAYSRVANAALAEQVLVLKELLALSRVAQPRYSYGSPDEPIRLEAIASRRLWDLLGEAGDLGIPLLQSGRPPAPVTVHTTPATAAVDVTRRPTGLRLRLEVGIDGDAVPADTSLLLGQPAHGIAWWGTSTSGTPSDLHLAPLSAPVDGTLRPLLGQAVDVPRADEERFVRDVSPALRRRVSLTSSDGSVDLPDVALPTLILFVEHHPGHRLRLAWARGSGAPGRRGRLWEDRHDRRRADGIVEAVAATVASLPELFEPTPWGERLAPVAELGGMAAVRFLTEMVPALEQVDGVTVEQTGEAPDYREADAAPVVRLSGAPSGDGDWFDLSVTVTVDGEEVPFADLFVALTEQRSHLLLPSGTYFSLDREELHHLAQLIAEARTLREVPGDGIPVGRFQASTWDELRRLGVLSAQAESWSAAARALVGAADRVDHPTPASLDATLRPYQQAGFSWLAYLYEHRLGGVLADDMGLGKTLQALALICHAKEHDTAGGPFLVVAPTSVVQNWASECRRFAPGLDVAVVTATAVRRHVPLAELAGGADVVVTSYSLFRLEYGDYEAVGWAGAFFDEAQFMKTRTSQTYQRAKLLPTPYKVAMTGTPMENNLMELWSLLSITAPGLFPDPEGFAEHYRIPIERGSDAERLAQLRRRIRPLVLRRTKEQVAPDLPDKQEQVLEVELNPRHQKLYQMYLQRERQKVLGLLGDLQKHRFEILRSITLLRQASLDASLVDDEHAHAPSTKLDTLMGMLDDIVADGHRVLVFSQFTRFLGMARKRLETAGIEHCYLDGRTRDRAAVITGFRTGEAPVFLISLKAGGFGLNLTEADYCILLDPWWNPATEAQAVDRVHRIGQLRKVMVYRLVAKGTIEEKVMALKAKKAALFGSVLDGGGLESGALTADDIRGLVS